MAGHFRSLPPQASQKFPPFPQFSGFMKPCRFEGEVQNLEVIGSIPPELDGTFYRVMPDPQLPPLIEDDPVSLRGLRGVGRDFSTYSVAFSGLTATATSAPFVFSQERFISSRDMFALRNFSRKKRRSVL
jgi:hypothetical protein